MDSVTQIVLGAAVGELVLGKKVGNKAILWGAIAGTIPDMDVLVKYFTDDLTANEMHRGFSHSIVFALLCAPLLGWLLHKIYLNRTEATFKDWTKLGFWSLVTHPLLDAHTNWGTQLFWPFDLRLAYKNISVVDPLYTLPFLICVVLAMRLKRDNVWRRKWNLAGLMVSSLYMVYTLVVKLVVDNKFDKELQTSNIKYDRLTTQPTLGNSILWYATAEDTDSFYVATYSLLDKKDLTSFVGFAKNKNLDSKMKNNEKYQRLRAISDYWYRVEDINDTLVFQDLRFGKISFDAAPTFFFNYTLSPSKLGYKVKQNPPPSAQMATFLQLMWDRLKGGTGINRD